MGKHWSPVRLHNSKDRVSSAEIGQLLEDYMQWLEIDYQQTITVVRNDKGARRYSWHKRASGEVEYHIPIDLPRGSFMLWDLPHNLAHIAHLCVAKIENNTEFTDSPRSRFFYEAVATFAEHIHDWRPSYFGQDFLRLRENETIMRRTRFEVEMNVFNGVKPADAISSVASMYFADTETVRAAWRSHSSIFGTASSFHVGPKLLQGCGMGLRSAMLTGKFLLDE